MRSSINQVAFSSNAYCREDVVACAHDTPDVCIVEFVDYLGRDLFQLVLENDEPYKVKARLCFRPLHLLNLGPAEFRDAFCGTSNHSKAAMRVIAQKIVVIRWN